VVLAPYYRRFDLPWEGDPEASRRFRLLATWGLALFFVFAVITRFVSFPEPERAVSEVPERLARLMVQERPKPPPPPPPPPVVEEPTPVEQPRPEPVPQPEQRQEQARRRAEAQLANVRDELASIRETLADQPTGQTRNLTGTVGAESRAERSLITSRAGTSSAGVASTGASRGFGGGAGTLSGHTTGTVQSNVAAAAASANVTRGSTGKPGRSAEEIEQEFDRNKGAIYGLYIRALRERADLQGKVVLEFTIAPEGAVTACRVVSSELNHPELEGRICARVRGFRFPARDVAPATTTKPIDFFPQG
jgi:protein TonB